MIISLAAEFIENPKGNADSLYAGDTVLSFDRTKVA